MLQQLAPPQRVPLQRALPLLVLLPLVLLPLVLLPLVLLPLVLLPLVLLPLVLLPLQLQTRLQQAHQMVPLELESLHRQLLVGARLRLRLRVKQSLHRPL